MPNPKDLHLRFAEYLAHTELAASSQLLYVKQVRAFGKWLAANPRYGDALIDVAVRDAAMAAYWQHLKATYAPENLRPVRVALSRMFHWLQLPPASFPVDLRKPPGATAFLRYGMNTYMAYRDGEPFKARAMCVDGRLRTTDRLRAARAGRHTAGLSLYIVGARFRISGSVVIEPLSGGLVETPDDPLTVKFEVHADTTHADLLGHGLWVPN